MKKISFAFFTVIFALSTQAQLLTEFPAEREKFLKTMDGFMKGTQLENCIQANEEFQELTKKGGGFDDRQFEKIVELSNAMLKRKMGASPYFYNFLTAINAFSKSKGDVSQFITWANLAISTAQNGPKGDNKEFAKFMEFSNSLYSKGAINATNSKMWRVYAPSYSFSTENGKVKVSFPQGRLVGYNANASDSMVIQNTAGDYWISANRWDGKGGLLTWSKAGLPANTVYANIKKPYSVSLENTSFSIDSVEFFHKEYFPYSVLGKYTDKFGSGDTTNANYPRFESDGTETEIKDIAPGIDYKGGFSVRGNKIMGFGTTEGKASVTFYKDKSKTTKVLTAYFMDFSYKKDLEVSSPKAQVLLFHDQDTIFHPELILLYNIPKRELKLLRSESAISRSKFIDTYHSCEFDVDAIFWNLDEPRMELKTLSGIGHVGTTFESKDYFSRARLQQLQGISSVEPLAAIKSVADKQNSRELNAEDVAKAINPNLTEKQAKSLFYELVQGGYIVYDEPMSIIKVRDRLYHFVLSNAKRRDYDNIRLKSVAKDGVDYIDLKTNNVDFRGVKEVPISDTAAVTFYPKDGFVQLQKNRNMQFGGLIYGGRMDFFGEDYSFRYDSFSVNLNTIDSMRINIPDGNKIDENGKEKLITLKTNIDGIKGKMDIDLPINKSGRSRLWQYPRLFSYDKSYAYYSDQAIAHGSYHRNVFYFELEPFRLDSLNRFSVEVINWKGKLVSGGIFPDIPERIKVQSDLSLGFTTNSPSTGWDTYKGRGNYKGTVTLDYRGLTGGGELSHLTSTFTATDFRFYLDSLWATADSFHIARSTSGPKTPEVAGAGNLVYWKPKSDSMHMYMQKKPFSIYQNQTVLKGDLFLSSKGLIGTGVLDWKEATISSKEFKMVTDELFADTAAMDIKSEFGDRVTFKTPNVKAYVNFKEHKAEFKSNVPETPTTFDYNKYKTNIREFKWDIDNKFLDFRVPAGEEGEYFESLHPDQMGLKFRSKRATYDLKTSILRCEQIKFIHVADAEVVPDSGVVIIRAEAAMDQLKKATILVDTTDRRYKIENCTLDIISKGELKGNGTFYYNCAGFPNQPISFADISCQKEVMGMKKTEFTDYSLVAKGVIGKPENFQLYPNVKFYGNVSLFGRNKDLYFEGYAKLLFKNPNVPTTDFNIIGDINPDKFLIHYDSIERDPSSAKLGLGLYMSDDKGAYTAIFNQLRDYDDQAIFHPVGVISYNAATNEYKFGEEDKINGSSSRGSVLVYDDNKGIITGEGGMTFPGEYSIMKTVAAGSMQNNLNSKQISLNLTFGLDMRSYKNIEDVLGNLLFAENLDAADINYGTDKFKAVYHTLADPKVDAKILQEYEINQQFKRPKSLRHLLVFSDVNFIFDTEEMTFRSFGKIGLSFVGERGIHKKLDGYIEIGPRSGGASYFNIYLNSGSGDWFFFTYRSNKLGLVSSYDMFNQAILAIDPDKRVVSDKVKSYTYTNGSRFDKDRFLEAQQEKESPSIATEKDFYRKKSAADSAEIARIKSGGALPPLPEAEPDELEETAPAPTEQKVAPKAKESSVPAPAKAAPAEDEDADVEAPAAAPKKTKEKKPKKGKNTSEEEEDWGDDE